jgi:hypothetical protein
LTPASRSALAAHGPIERSQRLAWALEAGDPVAWTIARPPRDAASDGVLALWAARRAAELGLPPAVDGLIVLGPDSEARAGWADAQRVLALLGPTPWIGPLVVVTDGREVEGLPAMEWRLVRQALPLLRVGPDAIRTGTATRVVGLAVDAAGPAPAWWRTGLIHLAAVRPEPGPRRRGEQRAEAGRARIDALLRGTVDDADLAAAVVAWCLDPRRLGRLPDLRRLMGAGPGGLDLLERVYPGLPGFD